MWRRSSLRKASRQAGGSRGWRAHRTGNAATAGKGDARKAILHSRELCSAAGTLAGVMLLGLTGPRLLAGWTRALGAF
jgi:hypothetical protein